MGVKTEQDFWIEMSIRETWTQAHFAGLAFSNIDRKTVGGTDGVFSSIHSFLSHCAMVSKMLKANYQNDSESIGKILEITNNSPIHNRKFRNFLEHYDKELKRWIKKKGIDTNIGTYNVGPKSMIKIPNILFVSHYDPSTNTYTFVDKDINLGILHNEVEKIKNKANNWVRLVESGVNRPPFT